MKYMKWNEETFLTKATKEFKKTTQTQGPLTGFSWSSAGESKSILDIGNRLKVHFYFHFIYDIIFGNQCSCLVC